MCNPSELIQRDQDDRMCRRRAPACGAQAGDRRQPQPAQAAAKPIDLRVSPDNARGEWVEVVDHPRRSFLGPCSLRLRGRAPREFGDGAHVVQERGGDADDLRLIRGQ